MPNFKKQTNSAYTRWTALFPSHSRDNQFGAKLDGERLRAFCEEGLAALDNGNTMFLTLWLNEMSKDRPPTLTYIQTSLDVQRSEDRRRGPAQPRGNGQSSGYSHAGQYQGGRPARQSYKPRVQEEPLDAPVYPDEESQDSYHVQQM